MTTVDKDDDPVCNFGKYQGCRFSTLRKSYLLWMLEINHLDWEQAYKELQRRKKIVAQQKKEAG